MSISENVSRLGLLVSAYKERAEAAEAERDRLRARLDVVNALAGSPPPGQAAWTHENLLECQAERDRLREGLHAMAGAMRDTMDERDRLRALAITAVRRLNAYNCVLCGYYGNDPDTRDHKPDCPVKILAAALSNPTATTEATDE